MDKAKKQFEDKWNDGGFSEKVMCDDGQYRLLESPDKIWKFFEKYLGVGAADDGELKRIKEVYYEQLAAIEHERWGDWQKYMHSQGKWVAGVDDQENGLLFEEDQIAHWERQMGTKYEDLTEREKIEDQKQVDRYWPLIEQIASGHTGRKERICKD